MLTDTYRTPLDFRVCSAPTVPVIWLGRLHRFDQPLCLHTDSFLVAVFSVYSPTFQACLDISYRGHLLYGLTGKLVATS